MMTAPVPIPDTLIVHDGSFHADDVLVAAMLGELNPDLRVLRLGATQIEPYLHDPSSLIADVGGGRFDHHQPDAVRREDGNKHAACGLVWEAFRDRLRPRDKERAAARPGDEKRGASAHVDGTPPDPSPSESLAATGDTNTSRAI